MSDRPPEQSDEPQPERRLEIEDIQRMFDAHMMHQGETRQSVITKASRIIDALNGVEGAVRLIDIDLAHEFASAPAAIPALVWVDVHPGALPEGEDWRVNIVGNAGEYYANVFSNERTSDTFNVGFYAGVLAVKAGLVVPDKFHHASEHRHQLPTAEDDAQPQEVVTDGEPVEEPEV